MKSMKYLTAVSMLLSCVVLTPDPTPPSPVPEPTAPAPEPEMVTCESVCHHFELLACEESKPTKNGATCTEVCQAALDSGLVQLDLNCAYTTTSCEAIAECSE